MVAPRLNTVPDIDSWISFLPMSLNKSRWQNKNAILPHNSLNALENLFIRDPISLLNSVLLQRKHIWWHWPGWWDHTDYCVITGNSLLFIDINVRCYHLIPPPKFVSCTSNYFQNPISVNIQWISESSGSTATQCHCSTRYFTRPESAQSKCVMPIWQRTIADLVV